MYGNHMIYRRSFHCPLYLEVHLNCRIDINPGFFYLYMDTKNVRPAHFSQECEKKFLPIDHKSSFERKQEFEKSQWVQLQVISHACIQVQCTNTTQHYCINTKLLKVSDVFKLKSKSRTITGFLCFLVIFELLLR